jgi:hypothetical protein
MMVNVPLPIVGAADMRRYGDGSGDIMFTLGQKKKLSYMLLWPNIKPWQFKPVVPAMRCLADVDAAAAALASVVEPAERSAAPAASAARNADLDLHGHSGQFAGA